eukprot:scaffold8141_cov139-Skeletonema_dohrnii-CCMP3373.AAC.23
MLSVVVIQSAQNSINIFVTSRSVICPYTLTRLSPIIPQPHVCYIKLISLRLLALILCSNCSNNPARLLSSIGRHRQTTFCNPEHHFCLQNIPPRMVEAFH